MANIEEIKTAVSEAIDEKVKDFYIDREKHWRHHEALEEFIDFWKTTKKTAWRTFIVTAVSGVVGLLWIAFKFSQWWQK